jgi:hypothetical protein
MARIAHAAQIDLRFGYSACEVFNFRVGYGPGNLARKSFNLFGQCRIGMNRQGGDGCLLEQVRGVVLRSTGPETGPNRV